MPLTYSEFTTTGANLLADLRAAILASSDWTQPNAGNANLLKATTTRGAQMVVDLNDSAPTTTRLTVGVYRAYEGTTGTDKITRLVRYKQSGTGTFNTNIYRCVVSASKEHLFFTIEGPRGGEVGADNVNLGSMRGNFFIADIVPYESAPQDVAPAVCVIGRTTEGQAEYTNGAHTVNVSRGRAGSESWLVARLATLDANTSIGTFGLQRLTKSGSVILSPYVVFEDIDGLRGRLANLYFGGWNFVDYADVPVLTTGARYTYDGGTYRLIAASRSGNNNEREYSALGPVANGPSGHGAKSPLVAVPITS